MKAVELLASKFSWEILKKAILKALEEPSKLANAEEAVGEDTDNARGEEQHEGGDQMHSSAICHQNSEEQATFSSSGISEYPDAEAVGGDVDSVGGKERQHVSVEVHSNVSKVCHQDFEKEAEQESSNSSRSKNVAAQPLVPEGMSQYEKIRAANVKQNEEMLRQLKRGWQGFNKSEGFATRGSRKRSKKLKVVEKEAVNTRCHQPVENVSTEDQQSGNITKQDLRTSGTGLDIGYWILDIPKQACCVSSG